MASRVETRCCWSSWRCGSRVDGVGVDNRGRRRHPRSSEAALVGPRQQTFERQQEERFFFAGRDSARPLTRRRRRHADGQQTRLGSMAWQRPVCVDTGGRLSEMRTAEGSRRHCSDANGRHSNSTPVAEPAPAVTFRQAARQIRPTGRCTAQLDLYFLQPASSSFNEMTIKELRQQRCLRPRSASDM